MGFLQARAEIDNFAVLEQVTDKLDILVRDHANEFLLALSQRDSRVAKKCQNKAFSAQDFLSGLA